RTALHDLDRRCLCPRNERSSDTRGLAAPVRHDACDLAAPPHSAPMIGRREHVVSHKRSRATRWFLTLVAAIVPAIGFVVLSAAPAAAVICGPIPIEGQVISCMPTASVTIGPAAPGSVRVDVSDLISITGGPKLWTMTLGSPTAPVVIGDLASISLIGTTKSDPIVGYGFAVTNFSTTTLDVDALFSSPYVGGPYTALFSSHSGST